jgi:2-polyprenyl-6-methoxyphenol hydroxylase-like FAD-dependent oxidoreductase
MTSTPRILIVGGGIGGLTLAALLRNSAVKTELVERAAAFAQVGAGITLGLNAMAVLDRIGARRDAESRGRVMRIAKITDETGHALAETDLGLLA